MNVEEEGNAYTCLDSRTRELEKRNCKLEKEDSIAAGS